MAAFPFLGWALLYYIVLFLGYHYLLYGYFYDIMNQQILGLKGTLALTAALILYLVLIVAPAFMWSRRNYSHPVWRGMECFICYAGVAIILGAIFSAVEKGEWSTFSGISAGDSVWTRLGSALALSLLFIAASVWGGRTTAARRRKRKYTKKKGSTSS